TATPRRPWCTTTSTTAWSTRSRAPARATRSANSRPSPSTSESPVMTDFSTLLSQGNAWLFIPTAVLLGALHGLEPGHSKTMMAAFIIAIRGTMLQAVLLGLSAAISHSLIIWVLAAAALRYGSNWKAETTEPYLQLFSAVLIAAMAIWMYWRTRREVQAAHDH